VEAVGRLTTPPQIGQYNDTEGSWQYPPFPLPPYFLRAKEMDAAVSRPETPQSEFEYVGLRGWLADLV
jgi:hypothetical protein